MTRALFKDIGLPPGEIRECLYLLDTIYQVRPDRMSQAEKPLIRVYNISEQDARLIVRFWHYIKTPNTIN
jgi:hypothetical protein